MTLRRPFCFHDGNDKRVVRTSDGRVFVCHGDSKKQIRNGEIRELEIDKGEVTWEQEDSQLGLEASRTQLRRLYHVLEATGTAKRVAVRQMEELRRRYPEIAQFQRVPGVGVVGAHVFSALIQKNGASVPALTGCMSTGYRPRPCPDRSAAGD